MKTIDISTPRHQKTFAIVDDEDYEDLVRFKWYMGKNGYAARNIPRPARGIEYMHRRIMGSPCGLVDHANQAKLDNRRSNLRITDRQGNAANMRTKSRAGLKGVTAHPGGWWRARIMVDGKQVCLGLHATPEAAHSAYADAAKKYFGEFARAS